MKERHLLALSGGKDSAALAVYMREQYSHLNMEYVFIDSGCELPETYAYLDRLRAILGIEIISIKSRRNFEYWLKMYNGMLPSPANRWCTRHLKLEPYANWLKSNCVDQEVYNYVGLRADEDRIGYQPKSSKVSSVFPFVNDGIALREVKNILEWSGIGLPEYYSWRQRSGCYFCFFQRDDEWRGLRVHHEELFQKAVDFEENHYDGRTYTWRDSGPLRKLSIEASSSSSQRYRKDSNLFSILNGLSKSSCTDNSLIK